MNRRQSIFVFSAALLAAACGCRRSQPAIRMADAEYLTTETLTRVLLGDPVSEQNLHPETAEKPLLKTGTYERVVIAADAEGFAQTSRGGVRAKDIREVESRVVVNVDKQLRKQGFSAVGSTFPISGKPEPRTLYVTITPATEEAGSPQERAGGKNDTLVLVRLTVTDPQTGAVLARRDFYSGADVRRARSVRQDSINQP